VSLYDELRDLTEREQSGALATIVSGPSGVGSKALFGPTGVRENTLTPRELLAPVEADVARLLVLETSQTVSYTVGNETFEVFIDVFPAPRQLVVVGATHVAIPLSEFARRLGYRVIVTDARSAFATPERFPDAHAVIKGWPQEVLPSLHLTEATYVVLLSHDPKFDEPTLDIVLPSKVPYVGAIGSRKTQLARLERLRAKGYDEAALSRLYGPVGLDIGAVSVEETALAILAEITAVRHARDGGYLRRRVREEVTAPTA
jgi:xanthine dehydrogenase accessory factor